MLVLHTDDFSISHTWYPLEGTAIRAAVRSAGATFDDADTTAILALSDEVAFVNSSESRVIKSRRVSLGREIFDLKWEKDHLVIFPDGGVERLGVYERKEGEMEEGEEEVERSPPAPLLQAGDRLLESWICQNKGTVGIPISYKHFLCIQCFGSGIIDSDPDPGFL